MIDKIKIPDTVDATWIGSYSYEMVMATNRIIDGLNDMEKRLKRLESENSCNCTKMIDVGVDDIPITSWNCPKHGRQTIGQGF